MLQLATSNNGVKLICAQQYNQSDFFIKYLKDVKIKIIGFGIWGSVGSSRRLDSHW